MGDPQGVDSLFARALALMRQQGIPDTLDFAQTLSNRVDPLQALGKQDKALACSRQAVAVLMAGDYDKTIFMAHAQNAQAETLLGVDSLAAAQAAGEAALEGFRRLLGEESHFVALAHCNLSKITAGQERFSAQAEHLPLAMNKIARLYGPETPHQVAMLIAMGNARYAQEQYEAAAQSHSEAVAMMESLDLHRFRDLAQAYHARSLLALGKDEAAGALLAAALAFQEETARPALNQAMVRTYPAHWLHRQGRGDEARARLM
ncbi:MAG: hypothetical protein D6722_01755 [Bacteroidetes bacterium]|nr:MAG: hypothetical protein D6722_01755 [Bacteroidota bacterium]